MLVLFLIIAEEIVTQNVGYAQQHLGVDALPLENIVDVSALATEVSCEPAHRALLAPKLLFDQLSDVYHVVSTKARAALRIHDRGSGMPTK